MTCFELLSLKFLKVKSILSTQEFSINLKVLQKHQIQFYSSVHILALSKTAHGEDLPVTMQAMWDYQTFPVPQNAQRTSSKILILKT